MKTKLLTFLVYAMVITTKCECAVAPVHDEFANQYQKLLAPIDLSATGFNQFVCDVYNQKEYADEVLPNDLDHVIQFLQYGKQLHQPHSYVQHVMRLFANKLKSSTYINASVFCHALKQLPDLMQSYFVVAQRPELHTLQENVNTLLYNSFLHKYSFFKANPSLFFNDLSQDIFSTLGIHAHEQEGVIADLRKTTLVFLEVALNKLIWNPEDGIDTWRSVKMIAEQLSVLMDHKIIHDFDDLNDLYITLVERYCLFVDIAATNLPHSFYVDIKQDLVMNNELLLKLEEQDTLITPKKDRLLATIFASEHRAQQLYHKEGYPQIIS
ncbi:MAG TPA: hypothetical protein VGT41_01560 [Candidatus Babeliales bacterium]|nr:hypothetical protein [Candidatus Babeliales bacterium]